MARRHEGRILKRIAKDGTVSFRLGWELPADPVTGKRCYEYKTVHVENMKAARAELGKILGSLSDGTYVSPTRATVRQCCEEWLTARLVRKKIRGNTYAGYAMRLHKYVIPRIGDMEIQKVTADVLQKLYDGLLSGGATQRKQTIDAAEVAGELSPKTVIAVHRNLRQVIHQAIKQRRLAFDPTKDVELPKAAGDHDATSEDAGGVIHALDEKRLGVLLDGFRGHALYAFVHLAAASGARRGELLGLRWCDVDFVGRRIRIEWVVVDSGNAADQPLSFARPKTKRSRRAIDLDVGTMAELDSHWKRQAEQALKIGRSMKRDSEELVFPRTVMDPRLARDPRHVTKAIISKAIKLGFDGFRLHDLRHTHASLLLQRGVNIKVVSERLGHRDASTTLNIYQHLMPGMQDTAVKAFADILGAGRP